MGGNLLLVKNIAESNEFSKCQKGVNKKKAKTLNWIDIQLESYFKRLKLKAR